MTDISSFLANQPSLAQLIQFIEDEAQKIAADRRKQAQKGQG